MISKILLLVGIIFLYTCFGTVKSQSVGIGTLTPDNNAMLDIKSSTKGMLIPRTSTVSRLAIVNPAKGLILYDSTTSSFWFHSGSAWTEIPTLNNVWNLNGNSATNPASNFIGTTDNQPLRFRVNNAWAGEIHPTSGNIFLGVAAGQANTGGLLNTALGIASLKNNTNSSNNVAVGDSALYTNNGSSGGGNTAVGTHSLFSSNSGINTAIGYYSLYSNIDGSFNTAIGVNSLYNNIIGNDNTAVGSRALQFTTGYRNTGTGASALRFNSFGYDNTANGFNALYSNTFGFNNTSSGSNSLYFNTTGIHNTANGYFALNQNTSACENTAFGGAALATQSFNNGGTPWVSGNTAVGFKALGFNNPTSISTGIYNTAVGHSALHNNTIGNFNVANGFHALYNNTTAGKNTAIGTLALFTQSFNNGGISWTGGNVAVGNEALYLNNSTSEFNGVQNTAIGTASLRTNSTGASNTASGSYALYSNTTGDYNTAIGANSLYKNSIGNFNTAVGYGADNDLSSSINNTLIGSNAHCSANNSVVIGYGSFTNTNNLALLGNPTTLFTGGYTAWSNFSDGRFKKNIDENVRGLDFIMRLRPVTYHMDVRGLYNFWGVSPYGKEDSTLNVKSRYLIDDAITKKEAVFMSGFVAQEVEKAATASNYDFDGVIPPTHDKDHYRIAYGEFVVPLVKAIQEQQEIIEKLQKLIAFQEKRLAALEAKK